VSSIIRMWCH